MTARSIIGAYGNPRWHNGEHCDRFVQWFNGCVRVFSELPNKPPVPFAVLLADAQQPAER
jgi:hypothetical protein